MSIDEVEASSTCLLTALHACGVLTDKVRALSVLSELRVVESISAVNDAVISPVHAVVPATASAVSAASPYIEVVLAFTDSSNTLTRSGKVSAFKVPSKFCTV